MIEFNSTQLIGHHTTVGFIRVVLAVIVSITDVSWVGAETRAALELAWSAFKLG